MEVAGAWTAPSDPGPLPSAAVERARELLARQQRAIAALSPALAAARREVRVVGSVTAATGPAGAPAYLDVRA
ncbi:hypothetical protein [Nocardioides sp. TF02-7]|uniref:hypothetical protein n=1 Tax=Nocardioides sp. TF02-7 TaxID=2917724 RepID=UPI001F057A74|nr:hypothetical protein [Nocardioides sp. TF02-7]UMG92951.1 hypothetical protein MF408_00845 [Nocardioides sp. TF02-7]